MLGVATVATAFVSESLVGSLEAFARVGRRCREFFVAIVIVAIVGNAAEHGGAIVVARRGKIKLATEIAVSSARRSRSSCHPWSRSSRVSSAAGSRCSFRPIELGVIGGSALLAALVLSKGRSSSWRGATLIAGYAVAAAVFYKAGGR